MFQEHWPVAGLLLERIGALRQRLVAGEGCFIVTKLQTNAAILAVAKQAARV